MYKKYAQYFMDRYKFIPRKRLGQNFLIDKNNIDKIIGACNLSKTDTVLEIGPGLGALTLELSKRVNKLIVVEIDSHLCSILRQKLKQYKNTYIFCQDVIKFDFSKFRGLKVVGNLPFYIGSSIIIRLLTAKKSINSIFVTVQKELGQRMVAQAGNKDYGSFSLFIQYHSQPQALFSIKRTCFRPKPKVDASFINLIVKKRPKTRISDEKLLFEIIRKSFSQRRKNILNALKWLISKDRLVPILSKNGISPDSRPDSLGLDDFIKLANSLGKQNWLLPTQYEDRA